MLKLYCIALSRQHDSHAAHRLTLRVSMSVIQTIFAPSMQPSSLRACGRNNMTAAAVHFAQLYHILHILHQQNPPHAISCQLAILPVSDAEVWLAAAAAYYDG
jgi:hypothetical protein